MSTAAVADGSAREVKSRLGAHWRLKFGGIVAFIAVFFAAYFALQRFPLFAVTVMPLTAIDRWFPFQPGMLGLYLSLWVYVSLPPSLLRTRAELHAYGWLAGALAAVGLGIFLLWPTTIPLDANIEWSDHPGFVGLRQVDAAQNACPSLHVAFAVFSGLWLDRMLRQLRAGLGLRLLGAAWGFGIIYSTIATRQHVFVDVLAGAALGLGVGWIQPRPLRLPDVGRK